MSNIKFLSCADYRNARWTEHSSFPSKAVKYRDWIRENRTYPANLEVYVMNTETNTITFIPEEIWNEFMESRSISST